MPRTLVPVLASAAVLVAGSPATGIVMGGGSPATDCYVALDGVTTSDRRIVCRDGDECDADGSRDAACSFDVSVCVNAYGSPGSRCVPRRRVTSVDMTGAVLDLPELPSLRSRCGDPTRITVPVRLARSGPRPGKLKIRLKAMRSVSPRVDKDLLKFECVPNPCADRAGSPKSIVLFTNAHGSDVDLGWSGAAHNVPAKGRMLTYCFADCPGSDQPCDATLSPGYATSSTALSPVPVVVAGTPLCLQPHLSTPSSIQAVATTGEISGMGRLDVAAYVSPPDAICPRCSDPLGGNSYTCDGGPQKGFPCFPAGPVSLQGGSGLPLYPLSPDCPPPTDVLAARISADVLLTTGSATLPGPAPCADSGGAPLPDDLCGEAGCGGACQCLPDEPAWCQAALGGVQQACCADDPARSCFPTRAPSSQSIIRVGAAVPIPPEESLGLSTSGTLVGAACLTAEPPGIALTSGLDGPAAIVLPISAKWLP